jgi:drug/metabolite transporter (DMT)-like permease
VDGRLRNRIFIILLVVSNTVGNLFLAEGMKLMPDFGASSAWPYFQSLLTNGWIVSGVLLLIIWMIAQLSMFTWADLSYVLPMTASAYVFTALLGKFVLGEQISAVRWGGIALVALGVILVSETPASTHVPPAEQP